MLFSKQFLDGIRTGAVTLAFRLWRRPSVRAGGTLLTPVGQLSIQCVEPVALHQITAVDVQSARYATKEDLLAELQHRS